MAKKKQIGLNVPSGLHEWLVGVERVSDQTKTRIGIAGLVLLELVGDRERGEAFKLASLVDRELVQWRTAVECARTSDPKTRSQKIAELQARIGKVATDESRSRWSRIGQSERELDERTATDIVKEAAGQKPKSPRRRKGA